LGKGAKAWLTKGARAAGSVAGKIGTSVAIDAIKEAIKGYYGL
jgi:hypothetical protein